MGQSQVREIKIQIPVEATTSIKRPHAFSDHMKVHLMDFPVKKTLIKWPPALSNRRSHFGGPKC